MNLEEKIRNLSLLRQEILEIIDREDEIINKAYQKNEWFMPVFIKEAIKGVCRYLEEQRLRNWLSNYEIPDNHKNKLIGVIMAGNIPLVGFHDLLTVLLSGNQAVIKLSHHDDVLIPYIAKILSTISSEFKQLIKFEKNLDGIDAVIATGSDNTSRYFSHTFGNIPHIIRKNRISCGILTGMELEDDYKGLSTDIFSFFGLGCRNVSKIFVPKNFNFSELLSFFKDFDWLMDHRKYYNNYLFQSTKYTLEDKSFIDGQFFILKKDHELVSPISCLYYDEYEDPDILHSHINSIRHKLQCIVSKGKWFEKSVPFGMAQYPDPWDYADNIDTMAFLLNL